MGLALPALRDFAEKAKPEFIIFQSGADCLANDPLGGLECSPKTHGSVTKLLHRLSHDLCAGRIVALGGGGYNVENCARAWIEVARSMVAEA